MIQRLQQEIKDFPEGGANPKGGNANLLFSQILPKTA